MWQGWGGRKVEEGGCVKCVRVSWEVFVRNFHFALRVNLVAAILLLHAVAATAVFFVHAWNLCLSDHAKSMPLCSKDNLPGSVAASTELR